MNKKKVRRKEKALIPKSLLRREEEKKKLDIVRLSQLAHRLAWHEKDSGTAIEEKEESKDINVNIIKEELIESKENTEAVGSTRDCTGWPLIPILLCIVLYHLNFGNKI